MPLRLGTRATGRRLALGALATLGVALCLAPVTPSLAEAPRIDPGRPFGDLDLTRWDLAQYLSGTQKDDARMLFLRGLDEAARADLLSRCRLIEADRTRFGADVLELCGMAAGVLGTASDGR